MSRYTVGQKYLFVSFIFECTDGTKLYSISPSKMSSGESFIDIETLELECCVEHDVPVEYGEPDDTAKGYTFSKDSGAIWYNQYPSASYGQVSTIGDSIVHESQGTLNEETQKREYNEFVSVRRILQDIQSVLRNAKGVDVEYAMGIRGKLLDLAKQAGYIVHLVPMSDAGVYNWAFSKVHVVRPESMKHSYVIYESDKSTLEEKVKALAGIGVPLSKAVLSVEPITLRPASESAKITFPDTIYVTTSQLENIPLTCMLPDKVEVERLEA